MPLCVKRCGRWRRWGYRMLTLSLRQEGFLDNAKRNYRICREEKLQVRRKRKRSLWGADKPAVPETSPWR